MIPLNAARRYDGMAVCCFEERFRLGSEFKLSIKMKNGSSRSAGCKSKCIPSNEHLVDGKYSIKDLVDINRLRTLFEEFSKTTGFTTGFVSFPDQEILIATGWRDACTKFHRPCLASAETCSESNIYLTSCLRKMKELSIKLCSNGLVDGATPVVIRGKHLASVSTGQVLFEPPDLECFKRQAKKYGYKEEPYLAAIRKLPVVTEQQLKQVLRYLSGLAVYIAEEGLSVLRVKEENELRRKSEQALQLSEEKYRTLFEGSHDAIFIRDTAGRLLDCNQAVVELFGFRSKGDLISTYPHDRAPEKQEDGRDSAAAVQGYIKECMRDGRSFFQWLSKKHDGTIFPIEVHLSRLEMEGGTVFLSVVHDISERKQAEKVLKESEQRYRSLFENMVEGYAHCKMLYRNGKPHDFIYLNVNNAFEKLTGIKDPCGKRISELIPGIRNSNPGVMEMYGRVATTGRTEKCEAYVPSMDTWFSISAYGPQRDHFIAVFDNITLRKRTEETILRANRALKAIDECNTAILKAQNEMELYQEVCRIIVESGGYETAWVGLAEHDSRKSVRPVAQAGGSMEFLKNAKISWANTPFGKGPVATSIRTRKVNICLDLGKSSIAAHILREARKYGRNSGIGLPLVIGNECIGALGIYSSTPDAFNIEQQHRLEGFAKNLIAGIVILRTRAEMERLQQDILNVGEQIQQKLGRELHDNLGQQLTGMALITGVTEKNLRESGSPISGELRAVLKMMADATSTARALAQGLYPVDIEPGGLLLTLERLAARASALPGINCRFKTRLSEKFTPVQSLHLFRIAQEAVSNALKHGKATEIIIEFYKTNGTHSLVISSNGISFRGIPKNGDGLGLRLMKYRAQIIGGTIDIRPGEKGGCSAVCSFP